MPKYTPDPWEVGEDCGNGDAIVTYQSRDICRIEMFYGDGQANAALISILPDLLEACEGLIEYRRRNTLNFQLEKADDFINAMKATIAKAKAQI
jgi:hypothetical protein